MRSVRRKAVQRSLKDKDLTQEEKRGYRSNSTGNPMISRLSRAEMFVRIQTFPPRFSMCVDLAFMVALPCFRRTLRKDLLPGAPGKPPIAVKEKEDIDPPGS